MFAFRHGDIARTIDHIPLKDVMEGSRSKATKESINEHNPLSDMVMFMLLMMVDKELDLLEELQLVMILLVMTVHKAVVLVEMEVELLVIKMTPARLKCCLQLRLKLSLILLSQQSEALKNVLEPTHLSQTC